MPVVGDRHRELGLSLLIAGADVAGHAEAVTACWVDGHERLVVVVIELGEVRELPARQARGGAHEAAVARQLGQPREARGQPCLVVRPQRPDLDQGAIAQLNLAAQLERAGRRRP